MEHIRKFPRSAGDVTLDRVRERVHAGRGCKPFGHRTHHIGVYYGDDGYIVHVYADHFSVFFGVGYNVVYGNFRRGSRSRGYGDYGYAFILSRRNAFERTDVCEFGVVYDNADCFGRIDGRAAAYGDYAVRAAFFEGFHARLYVLYGRVGFDIRIYFVRDCGFV